MISGHLEPRKYEVQSGDTLWGIAATHDMSLDHLRALNPQIVDTSSIMPGDIVYLNESASHPATRADSDLTSPVDPNCYDAKPDDWFISIGFNKIYAYPPAYKGQTHSGIDLLHKGSDTSMGLPFFAVCDGSVWYAEEAPVWGNVIVISHDDRNYMSRYAHGVAVYVKKGDQVRRGQHIGDIGGGPMRDGKPAFVPHLHFDVGKGDYFKGNPLVWDGHHPENIPKYYLNPLALI